MNMLFFRKRECIIGSQISKHPRNRLLRPNSTSIRAKENRYSFPVICHILIFKLVGTNCIIIIFFSSKIIEHFIVGYVSTSIVGYVSTSIVGQFCT